MCHNVNSRSQEIGSDFLEPPQQILLCYARFMDYSRLVDWQKKPELSKLNDLPNPPKELYYSGTWDPALFKHCVAVVGSRRMTEYGRRVIEKIVPRLVFEKKTIVSGFMYGVDQYAHRMCIENGGRTIAVLGWGITYPITGEERKLAQNIMRSGLILSEWKDQQPTLWTFPVRNRIIVALSSEVIIIEAAAKSGSLVTAKIAEKLKRPMWAVPGPITSPTSVGTNELIATGKARMWLGDQPQAQKPSSDPLLRLLTSDALTPNEIARKLGQPVSEVGAQLSLLTLTGQLIERAGKYYAHQD